MKVGEDRSALREEVLEGFSERVARGKAEDVQVDDELNLLKRTLHHYINLILEKARNNNHYGQIIQNVWEAGEKLRNEAATEKESRIKQVFKKMMSG